MYVTNPLNPCPVCCVKDGHNEECPERDEILIPPTVTDVIPIHQRRAKNEPSQYN